MGLHVSSIGGVPPGHNNPIVERKVGAALKSLAKRRKLTRNALIRNAVEDLLEKETRHEEWSQAVLRWLRDLQVLPFTREDAAATAAVRAALAKRGTPIGPSRGD